MSTIDSKLPSASELAPRAESRASRAAEARQDAQAASGAAGTERGGNVEALDFRRKDLQSHQLYESTRAAEESGRSRRVEEIRSQVQNGTYRPNLMIVAERMLSELSLVPA
jgi:anti-sigma28 factor (negative regulator of flagellin synthesis)